MYKMVPQH